MGDRLGSKWLTPCELLPEEQVLWSCLANRTQNRWRAVGGKLFVTNQRLVFLPHFFDAALKGDKWVADRSDVTSVGTVPPAGGAFSGGLRERVAVQVKDGSTSLFVVNDPRDTAQKLHEAGLPKQA